MDLTPEQIKEEFQDLELLTAAEVAAILKIDRSKVYQMIREKAIDSVILGGNKRIRRRDLEEFINNNTRKARI